MTPDIKALVKEAREYVSKDESHMFLIERLTDALAATPSAAEILAEVERRVESWASDPMHYSKAAVSRCDELRTLKAWIQERMGS